ncbi:MAG: (2Fe-2S)-binding protein, partial [Actinobacteria bacterium]|nr:(2Fe-2S)-binding protein [Actinomycetota bacterium]
MTGVGRIVLDGRPIPYEAGDSVAVAVMRVGEHPHHGGTICLAGDCGNCVAEVDGVAYVRTCQTPARPGLVIQRHPAVGAPPLRAAAQIDVTNPPPTRHIPVQRSEAEVVVIGAGESGTAAAAGARRMGRSVTVLDARDGMEAVAIYAGPTVIVRTPDGMLHIHAEEVVVATGAAELHPVCPGNSLVGLVTARAAEQLHTAGVDLGVAVAIGSAPGGVPCTPVAGSLRRIEGDGRVSGV